MVKQSYFWYIPIVIVLLLGYCIGGILVFGLHYLDWFPMLTNKTARLVLELFCMGMLGSTIYSTRYWAKDIEEVLKKPEFLPHAFDFFGYATTIVSGGIIGNILVFAIKAGLVLSNSFISASVSSNFVIRISLAYFIAFLGGLFVFKVQGYLEKYINLMLNED